MNRLSNILSPLDTCHGDTKVWAIHETSLGPSPQGCGPSFQGRHSQCSPTIGNILAIVVAVLIGLFIAMSLIDGPYIPKIDDTTGVAR